VVIGVRVINGKTPARKISKLRGTARRLARRAGRSRWLDPMGCQRRTLHEPERDEKEQSCPRSGRSALVVRTVRVRRAKSGRSALVVRTVRVRRAK
jgi:hypothetical protein